MPGPDSVAAEPPVAAATEPAAPPDPAVAATVPPAEVTPAADPPAAPRLRIDPLDLDPEGMDLASLLNGPAVDPLAQSEAIDAEPAVPAPSAAVADDPAGDPAVALAGAEAVRRADGGKAPAAPAVLLARRVPAVKIDGMPLADFLAFATSLSAMPVSVAPDELRLAAVAPTTTVSVDAKDATIEQVLGAALKPLRLAPAVEGGQIVLRRAIADQRRDLTYPVGDLGVDPRELARWVAAMVEPASWQAAGGAGHPDG